ncbi:MAG TPA: error-prone DNA polymerase [Rhizomicrobium sp.]|jgi:error-prone DNA polymerase|nr:error-prone DNA polymerase [Rhizomicrobium sp.]
MSVVSFKQDSPFRHAEIGVTSNYSFLRGASRPNELMSAAILLGLDAIGIADRNSLAGVVRAWDALKQIKEQHSGNVPKLLVGARLVFVDGTTPDILVYPIDRAAYGRLCQLISKGKHRAEKGDCILCLADLLECHEGFLLAIVPPARPGTETEKTLARLNGVAAGRVWLAASMLHHGNDEKRLQELHRIAQVARVPLLAFNDVLYHAPDRRELQDIVTCIREHVTLDAAGRLLEANAERHLKSPTEMSHLFRKFPQAVKETLRFASFVKFDLGEITYNYPEEPVPKGKSPDEHLADLTWQGAAQRYGIVPPEVEKTLHKELTLIAKLEIAPYFLTVHDVVHFAKEEGIFCQGRGSAANSAVCYVLGITAVDPTKTDLLFERFVSQERKEPPDIDVDFEHERREDVIQNIYKRYGHKRAALTATVITYRPRSAIREVGKVFGLTEDVTSALVSTLWGSGDYESWGEKRHARMRQAGYQGDNPLLEKAGRFAKELCGFPRHLSQHPGGFVLTQDPLDTIVPIGPAAMKDRYFIEWDKEDIDALRIMKVDVLALGMLTCVRKALSLVAGYTNKKFALADIPAEDPKVYDMLCKGDAIGVFQVESRAQINMLPRLKPREFYDLVVEVAIVRPGPIQGNMVHPYLRRRSGKEKVEYPSPTIPGSDPDELIPVLKKTLGIPLFQEQAMKLAMVAAEFTPPQANGLRRAMATFRNVGTIDKFKDMLIDGMTRRGYQQEFAERCFKQIEGFGSYGFPESHAASFALLVYVSAWIKKYHPAAFCCALLNSQPMGFYAPAELVRDAREHNVEVRHPDVNRSEWDNTLEFTLDGTPILRLGFRQIEGFKEVWWTEQIAKSRGNGFATFDAFARRAKLPKRALIVLAEADCFQSLDLDRRESLWAVRRLPDDEALPLFAAQFVEDMPSENITALPVMPLSEHTLADYQMMRLSLRAHLLQFLRETFRAEGLASCHDVLNARDGDHVRCAGIVITRQMPGDAGVVFITLSDETGVCNAVVWNSVFERWRKEVMGSRLMVIEGKIQRSEDNVVHLIAEGFADRTAELDKLSEDHPPADGSAPAVNMHRHPRNVRVLAKSHDFH